MHSRLLTLSTFVWILSQAIAQQPFCGAELLREQALSREGISAEEHLYQGLVQRDRSGDRDNELVIPVAFHIVHDNGPENVLDSVVQLAIAQVNARLQNAAPYTDVTGHVSDIQLCLAVTDPLGNSTTGITRHESAWTMHSIADQLQVKGFGRWDPLRYLNVWVVRSVIDQSVDGYSTFPTDLGSTADGVVIEAQYLVNNPLLVHELGHYLGLFHTFQGYCTNFNCQLDGDRICDTPPDWSSYFSCLELNCQSETDDTTGLSPFTGDVPELPNYMDYSNCPLSFSQGQVDRMRDVLIAVRSTLLTSYGCGAAPIGDAPVASCLVDSSECTGRVTFVSSASNADVLQWELDGGGWYTLIDTLVVDFSTPGLHTVTLLANGPGGGDTVQVSVNVRVPPTPQYPIQSGFEGIFADVNTGAPTLCYGTALELIGDPLLTAYQWSTGETTANVSLLADTGLAIRLTAVDTNGLSWTNCAWIEAGVVPPSSLIASTNDTVYCNQFVHLELVPPVNAQWYIGAGMIMGHPITYYYDHISTNFFPRPYWAGYYDPNGCVMHTDTFLLVTIPSPPPVITQVGDDLILEPACMNMSWYSNGTSLPQYFGETTLPDAAPGCYWGFCHECGQPVYSDTLCVLPTEVSNLSGGTDQMAYPVPAVDRLWITPLPAAGTPAEFMDASGRLSLAVVVDAWYEGIDVRALAPGLYVLRARFEGAERTWRFLKE